MPVSLSGIIRHSKKKKHVLILKDYSLQELAKSEHFLSISLLTNMSDANSNIMSQADFVDRNTGVNSIFVNSDNKHTWAAVTNVVIVKVELIHMGIWIGICTAVKRHSRAT